MKGAELLTSQPKQLRHFVWGLAAGWTAVVAALLLLSIHQEQEQAFDTARTQARSNFQRDLVYRHWVADYGAIYVPVSREVQPSPYLAGLPERDITTPSGKRLTMVNPAFMTRLVFDLAAKEYDIRGRITSLTPLRAENRADLWESRALKAFEQGESEYSSIETMDGAAYLRLIRPLKVEGECLQCHGRQGYKYGEVRGGISVAVPMGPLQVMVRKNIIVSSLSFALLWVAGLGGIFAGAGRLRQVIRQRDQAGEEVIALNRGLLQQTAALETANRELDAFCAAVSHDLKSPVTAIGGYSQLLQDLPPERHPAGCEEYGRIIHKEALRMDKLIETLLDLSRLSRRELRLEKVDLSELAVEIAADLRQREPQRQAEFTIAPAITVAGDPQLLRVVLQNLLGNSWKYTSKRETGAIEFGVTQRDGVTVLFVRDNGVGFAMAEAEQIFEPFRRLPGAEAFKGSGVGLATVKRIIDRHGGRIWAEGEIGSGAAFYFALPETAG